MSRNMLNLVCVVIALAATSLASAAALDNPFTGSWAGTFLNLDSGTGGVLEWTIDDNGRLLGTYLWDNGDSGQFVGTVRPDGHVYVAAPGGGGGFAGIAHLDGSGDMIVDAVDQDSGQQYLSVLSSS